MAELTLCKERPKKAKKKKQRNESTMELKNVTGETTTSLHTDELICQKAAEIFCMDTIAEAVQLSENPSFESLSDEQAQLPPSSDLEPVQDYDLNELEKVLTEILQDVDEVVSESAYNCAISDSTFVIENVTVEDNHAIQCSTSNEKYLWLGDTNSKGKMSSDNSRASLKNEPSLANTAEITGKEEPQSCPLKPSVFVGKGKLYSSSLQIGCQWDRTKYNIVLLPDLNKVVYPDLDSLIFNKPSADPFSKPGIITRHGSKIVDRSSKPKALTIYKTENGEMSDSIMNTSTCEDEIESNNQLNRPDMSYSVSTDDSRFTDFSIDGVDFRVFMSPVKWIPVDNYQLVIFRVGPLYFEEFFTNCVTTDGLIQAIKQRADQLAKRQLLLAQMCLLTETDENKSFRMPNATLVIYGCPSKFNSTVVVRFGVNEAFYEESFQGCKSLEDLIMAVKNRSELICIHQRDLKSKAYSGKGANIEPSMYETLSMEGEVAAMSYFENQSDNVKDYKQIETHDNSSISNAITLDASGKNSSDSTSKGFRKKFNSLRKWLKATFTKKGEKGEKIGSSVSTDGHGGIGNNDIVWQWNDSPEAQSSGFLNDGSENLRE